MATPRASGRTCAQSLDHPLDANNFVVVSRSIRSRMVGQQEVIRQWRTDGAGLCKRLLTPIDYCSFVYSAFASFRMGMSGSASFQRVRKSL
jgi:hypothetical protein